METAWSQCTIKLAPKGRGCHLITNEVESQIAPAVKGYKVGLAHLFLQHSSASITINENADPDVRKDMEMMLDRLVPEDAPYIHTDEGPDDMPGHVKSSLFGVSITIPIQNGKLALGTWQGIWLCEFRNKSSARRMVVTLQGSKK